MNYAIVYSSPTGNTAKIAAALRQTLPPEDCLCYGPPSGQARDAALLFVGFWTDKGTCDAETASFLRSLSGKNLCLFGTAGFGGDPAYFDQILTRVKAEIPAGNQVKSAWMCQGRMPPAVRQRYEAMRRDNPGDQRAASLLQNFDAALTHPDETDLREVAKWGRSCYDGFR